jgi:hypothetical protein
VVQRAEHGRPREGLGPLGDRPGTATWAADGGL